MKIGKMKLDRKVVIIILLVLLLSLIGIGIFSLVSYINRDKYKKLDVKSEIVTDLFYLTRGGNNRTLFYGTPYQNLYYIFDKIEISEMEENFKLYLSYLTVEKTDGNVKAKSLKEQYIKIFGIDKNYKDKDINVTTTIRYNADKKEYVIDGGSGNELLAGHESKIVEAREYNNRIEIYEKIAFFFVDHETDKEYYFINPNYSDILTTTAIGRGISLETYEEQLLTYKYTFEKKGDNYYFSKVEKIVKK